MIPAMNIIAWSQHAPWAEQRQVEQDLIISRALVELFSDPFLAQELRFRGGTALNKLHFPRALRYSEDIDLVRTTAGPIRPILDRVHDILDPWMGQPNFAQSPVAPKLKYTVEPEDRSSPVPHRHKSKINTREEKAYDQVSCGPSVLKNPWFSGAAEVPDVLNEELLATKLRALLQRKKGRDLIDLPIRWKRSPPSIHERSSIFLVVTLAATEISISRAQTEQHMCSRNWTTKLHGRRPSAMLPM